MFVFARHVRVVVVRIHIGCCSASPAALLLPEFLCISRQSGIFSDLSLQRRHASRRGVDSTKNQSSPKLIKEKVQDLTHTSKRGKRQNEESEMDSRNRVNHVNEQFNTNDIKSNGDHLDLLSTSVAAERLAHAADNGDVSPIFNATLRRKTNGTMQVLHSQVNGKVTEDVLIHELKNGVPTNNIDEYKKSSAIPSPSIRSNSSINRNSTSCSDRLYSNNKNNQSLVLGEYLLCDEDLNIELKTFKPFKRVENGNELFSQEDRIAVHVIEMAANGHDEENVIPKCLKIDSEMFI